MNKRMVVGVLAAGALFGGIACMNHPSAVVQFVGLVGGAIVALAGGIYATGEAN